MTIKYLLNILPLSLMCAVDWMSQNFQKMLTIKKTFTFEITVH